MKKIPSIQPWITLLRLLAGFFTSDFIFSRFIYGVGVSVGAGAEVNVSVAVGTDVFVSVGAGTEVKVSVGAGAEVNVSVGAGAEVYVSVGNGDGVSLATSDVSVGVGELPGPEVKVADGRTEEAVGDGVDVGDGPMVGVFVMVAVPEGAGEGVKVQVGGEQM